MKISFIIGLISVMLTFDAFSQNFNRPVPEKTFKYEFKSYQALSPANYFISPFKVPSDTSDPNHIIPMPMLLDENGYLLWYMRPWENSTLFRPFESQNKSGFINRNIQKESYYKILDENFQYIDSFTNSPGIYADVHEFIILDNGNYLISGAKDSIMDLSAYTFDGVQGSDTTRIIGFVIEEFDINHNLIFQWNSNDYIHPNESIVETFGYHPHSFDYCHGNAIEQDYDGNFLVSMRHLNAIYKISRTTGAVIWILGGKSSYFSFTNDPGFSGQHDIRRLANGNVSLYDNANSAPAPKESRAVEYLLDTINWTAAKVWEFKNSSPIYAFAMGNFQTTSQGTRLINFGFSNSFYPHPNISVIDATSNAIADIFFGDSVYNYRAYVLQKDLNLPRPLINCFLESGLYYLAAPSGYDKYLWSTGDTTEKIQIQTPGEYQLWVNYGIGMLGSEPITITNLAVDCKVSGISPNAILDPEVIEEIFDISGRRIFHPKIGNLYLVRYSTGNSQIIAWNESYRKYLQLK